MAKNNVQFQKGFSLVELQAKCPSEEQCRGVLFRWRWPEGFNCPECGHTWYCHIKSRKVIQCHRCHHQTSVISGTTFASTKLPLLIWFLAIYLIPSVSMDGWRNLS